ncbi:hypothetical protein J1605_015984 [Eschrichtius robustus]|uniref:Uncharacterized protein n=1 Tax=Eschrichtius robustus TaxID=9764 RepID=A0AB34G892_ESCRO|nr:hypothetical protein J1605_015984 [Eschrichtius robustus]
MCSREGLLNFENVEYVVFYLLSGQGPASSLNCPAIDILEFLSTGNELLLLTLRPIYLLPQSASKTVGMGLDKDISYDLSLHFADEEIDEIGFTITRHLVQDGAHVVVSSQKQQNVGLVVAALKGVDLNVMGTVCHVGKGEDREQLVAMGKLCSSGLLSWGVRPEAVSMKFYGFRFGERTQPHLPRKVERSRKIPEQAIAGASLVAQWLRIRLPMQGTQVQSLVQEDTTCRGATKPVQHNY